jgi:hypothetical protein
MDMTYIRRLYNMFPLINPSSGIWLQGLLARNVDNLNAICEPIV